MTGEVTKYVMEKKIVLNPNFDACVKNKCCRMVDSVTRWGLSLLWSVQSDHLSIADRIVTPVLRKHSHGTTQYIPGKQVLVRS